MSGSHSLEQWHSADDTMNQLLSLTKRYEQFYASANSAFSSHSLLYVQMHSVIFSPKAPLINRNINGSWTSQHFGVIDFSTNYLKNPSTSWYVNLIWQIFKSKWIPPQCLLMQQSTSVTAGTSRCSSCFHGFLISIISPNSPLSPS